MPLDFKKDIILQNSRALLRPLTSQDFSLLLPFALQEPELWQYSLIQAIGEDGLRNYLKVAQEARLLGREYPFIVYDKQVQAYAGSTRFYDIQPANSSLQLGYTWYGRKFQRTGLNWNCKFMLLDLAFDGLGMERVEFRADLLNERSIAAMKGIGCTVEGVLRSNGLRPDGSRRDSIVLSILRSEWKTEIREKLLAGISDQQ